jgi:hypothetical protein
MWHIIRHDSHIHVDVLVYSVMYITVTRPAPVLTQSRDRVSCSIVMRGTRVETMGTLDSSHP